MHSTTKAAMAAIGEDEPDADYKLRPEQHAAAMTLAAGPLQRILTRAEIAETIATYNREGDKAAAAQKTYKRYGHLGLRAALVATLIGAASLLPLEPILGKELKALGLMVEYAALALAFVMSQVLIRKKPFDSWMQARAEAERARVRLFDQVMAADEAPREGEVALLPLKLEYFRRYQLDVQRRYYRDRGGEHAQSAGQSRRWRLLGALLSGTAALVATVAFLVTLRRFGVPLPDLLQGVEATARAWLPKETDQILLAVGVVSSALLGYSSARSWMNLDERNASRYASSFGQLELLSHTRLDAARDFAVAADADGVGRFVAEIQSLISSEHQQWYDFGQNAPRPDPRQVPGQK
ncbi:MAG: hypothetical protein AB7E70_02990 [Hyphomicrobiaceae bacterium]